MADNHEALWEYQRQLKEEAKTPEEEREARLLAEALIWMEG